jgi:hypothetical protein
VPGPLEVDLQKVPDFDSGQIGFAKCLLLAQSGHFAAESQCPLLGVKRTSRNVRFASESGHAEHHWRDRMTGVARGDRHLWSLVAVYSNRDGSIAVATPERWLLSAMSVRQTVSARHQHLRLIAVVALLLADALPACQCAGRTQACSQDSKRAYH